MTSATTLREEINAAKRHRAYVIKVPGDHVEIPDGQPVLVPPTPAQLSELSQVHVTEPSRHGITHRQPVDAPDGWVEETYAALIAQTLGIEQPIPTYADHLAPSVIAANRPTTVELHDALQPGARVAVLEDQLGRGRCVAPWHTELDCDEATWTDPETQDPIPVVPTSGRSQSSTAMVGHT